MGKSGLCIVGLLLVLLPLLYACGEDSSPVDAAKAAPATFEIVAVSGDMHVLTANQSGGYEVWLLFDQGWSKESAILAAIPVPPDSILFWSLHCAVTKDLIGWSLVEGKWLNMGKFPPAVNP